MMMTNYSPNSIYEGILIKDRKENDIQYIIDGSEIISKEDKLLLLALWYAWHGLITKSERLLKMVPENYSILYREIELLISSKKGIKFCELDKLIVSAKKILTENELSIVANIILGKMYYAIRQYPQSISHYEKIINKYPKGNKVYLYYCEALFSNRHFIKAREALINAPDGWRKLIYKIIFPMDDEGKRRSGGLQIISIISGALFCIPIFRAGIEGALINIIILLCMILFIFILMKYFGERIIIQVIFIIIITGGIVTIICGAAVLLSLSLFPRIISLISR